MRSIIPAVLALLVASALHAQAPAAVELEEAPVAEAAVSNANLAPIAVPALTSADGLDESEILAGLPAAEYSQSAADEAAMDPFTTGTFWWYVGIIVVAGIILAVVL